jgi:glycosyltransferase involved in cell wall biosynthesis
MSIFLDISAAVHAKAGLSRYAASLARALLQEVPERLAFFFNVSGEASVPAWVNDQRTRRVHAGYKPWRMMVWLGHLARLGFDRLVPGCDLFHATEHLLLPLKDCPSVLTVHDLVFQVYPERHKPLNRWYLRAALPLYCRRANAIICVSEHTKKDLVDLWGIDREKVHVVYEAADPRFGRRSAEKVAVARARYGLPERYLLVVGTIEPRKNLNRLLDAIALVRQEREDVKLVIVGRLGWLYQGFLDKLEQFEHREAVIRPGFVPDADLPAVYQGAVGTVYPSLYEGFGLPMLESMACGTPVISSRASSLPELGGDAAYYFDPLDVEEMAAALGAVWRDADLRRSMRERGLARASQFSWTRAARETLEVYRSVGLNL